MWSMSHPGAAELTLCDLLQTQHILRADQRVGQQVLLRGLRDAHLGGVAAFLHFHRRLLGAAGAAAVGPSGVSGWIATGRLLNAWRLLAVASVGTRIAHSALLLLLPPLQDTKHLSPPSLPPSLSGGCSLLSGA